MSRKKLSLIFIPLILLFFYGIILYIGKSDFIFVLILDIILIAIYTYLYKRSYNPKIIEKLKENGKIKIEKQEEKKKMRLEKEIEKGKIKIEKQKEKELKHIEKAKWIKLAENFLVSEEYQTLKINNKDINFIDIISAELIEDENVTTITKGKEKSQKHVSLGKAIVGGALFGDVGAIIGGTSGKTTTNVKSKMENVEYCTKLYIKITINDINNPYILYKFISMKTKKNSWMYSIIKGSAEKAISTLDVIINNN